MSRTYSVLEPLGDDSGSFDVVCLAWCIWCGSRKCEYHTSLKRAAFLTHAPRFCSLALSTCPNCLNEGFQTYCCDKYKDPFAQAKSGDTTMAWIGVEDAEAKLYCFANLWLGGIIRIAQVSMNWIIECSYETTPTHCLRASTKTYEYWN